jgi:hypothetical protein
MPKPSVTTRATKGSALTWTEGDQNLENLRDATVSLVAGTGGTSVSSDLNGSITLVAGTNVTLSGDNTAKTITINSSGGSGDIVNDTTPQLGGNLDVNGNSIVSVSNGNIAITPNGTGSIVLDGLNWPQADGTSNQVLKTDGSGQLSWTTVSGGGGDVVTDTTPQLGGDLDVNGFVITSTGSGHVKLKPNASGFGMVYAESYYMYVGRTDADTVIASPPSSTGDLWIKPDTNYDNGIKITNGANATILLQPRGSGNIRLGSGSANATLTTVSTYDLILNTNNGTSSGNIRIYNGANGNIEIAPDGTGDVYVNADTLRVGDASSAATITTNGTGNLTLSTNNGTNSGTILINQGANGNIAISPNGTGVVQADKSIQIQATGDLRLADTDSSHYVGFKAPATVTTNRIWTLPAADGTANQVLSTNGSGTLSWATAGGGGASYALFFSTSDQELSRTAANSLFPITASGGVYWTADVNQNSIVTIDGQDFLLGAGTFVIEVTSVPLFALSYGPGSASSSLTSPTAYFNIFNVTSSSNLVLFDFDNAQHMGNNNSVTYKTCLGNLTMKTEVVLTGSTRFRIRYTGANGSTSNGSMRFAGARSITLSVIKIA